MVERPSKLRMFNITAGIAFLLLGAGVLVNFGLTKQILTVILSFILVFVSLTRVVNGLSDRTLSENSRLINMFVGGIGLSMALIVIILPELEVNTALLILGIGVSVQGIARIAVGGTDQTLATWARGLMITVGIITLVLVLILVLLQTSDESVLIAILAYAFIANGLARVAKEIAKSRE